MGESRLDLIKQCSVFEFAKPQCLCVCLDLTGDVSCSWCVPGIAKPEKHSNPGGSL